jgi:hypothetical protein
MRILVLILTLFHSCNCFAQTITLSKDFKKEIKLPDIRKPDKSSFELALTLDTSCNNNFINMKAIMQFKKSATMYDATKIILLPNNKFIGYTYNCLQEGSTAGHYTFSNDTLIISSSKKVFNTLIKDISSSNYRYPFFEINTTKFIIRDKTLTNIK